MSYRKFQLALLFLKVFHCMPLLSERNMFLRYWYALFVPTLQPKWPVVVACELELGQKSPA